jgi:hypothetical protein
MDGMNYSAPTLNVPTANGTHFVSIRAPCSSDSSGSYDRWVLNAVSVQGVLAG